MKSTTLMRKVDDATLVGAAEQIIEEVRSRTTPSGENFDCFPFYGSQDEHCGSCERRTPVGAACKRIHKKFERRQAYIPQLRDVQIPF